MCRSYRPAVILTTPPGPQKSTKKCLTRGAVLGICSSIVKLLDQVAIVARRQRMAQDIDTYCLWIRQFLTFCAARPTLNRKSQLENRKFSPPPPLPTATFFQTNPKSPANRHFTPLPTP